MSDIDQFHQRLSAAMDRIAYGITQFDAAGGGEAETLRTQLEEEKTVTAQLEERVRAMKDKQARESEAAQAAMADIKSKVEALDLEMQKLRGMNDKLRETNQALREANEAGVGEPDLINASVLAELDSLRAARATEQAEVEAILSALAPALAAEEEGAEHA